MQHTEECESVRRELTQLRAAWLWRWGAISCPTCGGVGIFWCPGDWVPYGSTSARLPDYSDPCPACWELGICPRCGEKAWNEKNIDNSPCFNCGWTERECPPHPDQYECCCWDIEYQEYARQEAERQNTALTDV
jgi:hypothetical protein